MFALGINDADQIVGWFFDNPSTSHGFLYNGATYTTLDAPGSTGGALGGTETAALGINSAGEIVGWFFNGSRSVGFLKSGATYTEFDIPGNTNGTSLNGINTAGQIVGSLSVSSSSGTSHGFLATPISLETQIAIAAEATATIFGSATLDVTTLDPTTLRLGPNEAVPDPDLSNPAAILDVNADGIPDLVVSFRQQDTGLSAGAPQACFIGSMSGQTFLACDAISKPSAGCGLGFELAPILPALLWLRGRRRRKVGVETGQRGVWSSVGPARIGNPAPQNPLPGAAWPSLRFPGAGDLSATQRQESLTTPACNRLILLKEGR
jgi:hypothetical protein